MDSSPVTRPNTSADEENWRLTHLGRLLGHALRRFDERVLVLM
ncbi:MAG: MarR family transcriptional regulator, partial [Polaromonas sp.]